MKFAIKNSVFMQVNSCHRHLTSHEQQILSGFGSTHAKYGQSLLVRRPGVAKSEFRKHSMTVPQ